MHAIDDNWWWYDEDAGCALAPAIPYVLQVPKYWLYMTSMNSGGGIFELVFCTWCFAVCSQSNIV